MNNGPGCAVIACMVFWAIVIAVITVAMIMTMHNAMISFVCFLLSLLVI